MSVFPLQRTLLHGGSWAPDFCGCSLMQAAACDTVTVFPFFFFCAKLSYISMSLFMLLFYMHVYGCVYVFVFVYVQWWGDACEPIELSGFLQW